MSAPAAPGLVARTRTASPRTADLPMAFTRWEFIRGALLAYFLFLLGLAAVGLIWGYVIGFLIAPLAGAPFAAVTLVSVGAPLAYAIGMALRRSTATWLHLTLHGLNGLHAAAFGLFLYESWNQSWQYGVFEYVTPLEAYSADDALYLLPYVLMTVPSVLIGWWITSRMALHADH